MAAPMGNRKFSAFAFLLDTKAKSVFLHLRDANTKINPNQWAFFGGQCNKEETPLECVKREMKEEIGVVFQDGDFIPLRDYWNEELSTHRYVFLIKSKLPKSAMKLGEGADFDWVPIGELHHQNLTSRTAQDLHYMLQHFSKFQ